MSVTSTVGKRGFWRTNIEAFTVAVVMALLIKQFAFEAFQVPTESMEPTIIGRNPGGDRIIVDKAAALLGNPERFEVQVFMYPLSQRVNYVKRLMGMPGETLKIAHGDIFVAAKPEGPFHITRKSLGVQAAIFDANPVIPTEAWTDFRGGRIWNTWQRPAAGATLTSGGQLQLDAGPTELLVGLSAPVTPERHDALASTRRGRADETIRLPVGDVRFSVDVTPAAGAGSVILRITDGTQVTTPIRLELAVQGAAVPSRLLHGARAIDCADLTAARLQHGKSVRISFENVDDRIRVLIDGTEICCDEYEQSVIPLAGGESRVAFGLTSGSAAFSRLALERDIYTTLFDGTGDTFHVPEGHYLLLGDNSANSLDARAFRMVGIRMREDGRILLGDLEAVSDEFDAPRQDNNPWLNPADAEGAARLHQFMDIAGNHLQLESTSYDILDLTRFPNKDGVSLLALHGTCLANPQDDQLAHRAMDTRTLDMLTAHAPHAFRARSVLMHYVPREFILGRAGFIFLPAGNTIFDSILNLKAFRVIR
ncbi:MAG: signal peptidase I [Planctomycetes bacterium]|nr:signal peptidase I [Planctomycetota bacterium]